MNNEELNRWLEKKLLSCQEIEKDMAEEQCYGMASHMQSQAYAYRSVISHIKEEDDDSKSGR